MITDSIVYVGTTGQGVWRSLDLGETFQRRCAGMFMEAEVRALAVHPTDPKILFAGTDAGVYRTVNGGERWIRLDGPFDPGRGWPAGIAIWSLLIHPANPDVVFAGACPSALYRSLDAGDTWHKLDATFTPECPPILFSRVTCIKADPENSQRIWAGVEIDGAWRSDDGGDTWLRLAQGLSSADVHDLHLLPGPSPMIMAATNNDLNVSRDNGRTWEPQQVKANFPFPYCRAIAARADDPRTLFVGNGNGPPGSAGALQVSNDAGRTWRQAELPTAPNSTIWAIATHKANPGLIFCASINGYIYRSEDSAATWSKCAHEFGEVRSLAFVA